MIHVQIALSAWLFALIVVRKKGPYGVIRSLRNILHATCDFCTAFWAWVILEIAYKIDPVGGIEIVAILSGFAVATLAVGLGGHIISEDN